MQSMWLCIILYKQFEETFENAHWREVKQMQSVWFCILWGRLFEAAYENTQWRKGIQMLDKPVRLIIRLLFGFASDSLIYNLWNSTKLSKNIATAMQSRCYQVFIIDTLFLFIKLDTWIEIGFCVAFREVVS